MRRFRLGLSVALAVLILLPTGFGLLSAPAGSFFLGYPYNTDDHMVYAAWMRQAAEGRLLFSNRFTLDPQPGLTLHLYFLVLGWVSRAVGLLGATAAAQVALAFAFVRLLDDLVARATDSEPARKLALLVATFGGGLGFLAWRTFGVAVEPELAGNIPFAFTLRFALPTDVWQPEGFVFPSLLTNSLFAWALVLILLIGRSVLVARESSNWRPVAVGAGAFFLLANTHSYDALLLGLVLVGFVGASAVGRTVSAAWLGRAGLIAAGAIPAAAYLLFVLRNDPVFQARAATPTFAPGFRPLLFGYLPLMLAAIPAALPLRGDLASSRRTFGVVLFAALMLVLFVVFAEPTPGFLMTPTVFLLVYGVAVAAAALAASGEPARDLLLTWAFVGTIAMYFPADFQRKLGMGLALPWGVLGGIGIWRLLSPLPTSTRRLAIALPLLPLFASSLRWFARQFDLIRSDVASTTVQSVFLPNEVARMADVLRRTPGAAFLAPPGIPLRLPDGRFVTPALPDLNPILVGIGGGRAYAGHWSETPAYSSRRGEVSRLYFGRDASASALLDFARRRGIAYAVVPAVGLRGEPSPLRSSALGEPVVAGTRFLLYRLSPAP